jgi:hypothetical protein
LRAVIQVKELDVITAGLQWSGLFHHQKTTELLRCLGVAYAAFARLLSVNYHHFCSPVEITYEDVG